MLGKHCNLCVHVSFINYTVGINSALRNTFLSMKQSQVGSLHTGISNILPFYDYRVFMPNTSCSFVLCFPFILFLYSFYGKNTAKGFAMVIQPTFLTSYGELNGAFIHAGRENALLSSCLKGKRWTALLCVYFIYFIAAASTN